MTLRCSSGKIKYPTQEIAEGVLIELWTKNEYAQGQGPVNVYRCDDCGDYHLTSKGTMNEKLAAAVRSKSFQWQKQGKNWDDKFKKR
jgi:hypothetical protein